MATSNLKDKVQQFQALIKQIAKLSSDNGDIVTAINNLGTTLAGQLALEVTADQINLNTDDLERSVWGKIPGNSLEMTYYAGVEATAGNFGNPSGSTDNVKTITYKTGGVAQFYQDFAYNAANNTTLVTARV